MDESHSNTLLTHYWLHPSYRSGLLGSFRIRCECVGGGVVGSSGGYSGVECNPNNGSTTQTNINLAVEESCQPLHGRLALAVRTIAFAKFTCTRVLDELKWSPQNRLSLRTGIVYLTGMNHLPHLSLYSFSARSYDLPLTPKIYVIKSL